MPKPYTPTRTTWVSLHCTAALASSCHAIPQDIDDATRAAISRVSNIIKILASHFVPLTDGVLLEAYEWAVEQENSVKDLLSDEVGENLVANIGLGMRQ